jgi:hypothetical protein
MTIRAKRKLPPNLQEISLKPAGILTTAFLVYFQLSAIAALQIPHNS